jgi:hypothetical protein
VNVYVVTSCGWREGVTVTGAATDLTGAETIADRYDLADDGAAAWAPWRGRDGGRWRDALRADGTIHSSLYQEIVAVPLVEIAP